MTFSAKSLFRILQTSKVDFRVYYSVYDATDRPTKKKTHALTDRPIDYCYLLSMDGRMALIHQPRDHHSSINSF